MSALRIYTFEQSRDILITRARSAFGDSECIQARNILEEVDECVAAIAACSHNDNSEVRECQECRGKGHRRCGECGSDDMVCPDCEGSGRLKVVCECLKRFDMDVIREAVRLRDPSSRLSLKGRAASANSGVQQ